MLCTEPLFRRYFSILSNTKAGTLLIMIAGAAALNRSVYILLRNDVRFSSLGSHRLGIGDGWNRLLRADQYHRRETCQVSQLDDAPSRVHRGINSSEDPVQLSMSLPAELMPNSPAEISTSRSLAKRYFSSETDETIR